MFTPVSTRHISVVLLKGNKKWLYVQCFYLIELRAATVTLRWVEQGRWWAYKKSSNVLRSKSCACPQGSLTWCIAVWEQGTQLGTKKTELAMIIPTKHSSTWHCRKLKAVEKCNAALWSIFRCVMATCCYCDIKLQLQYNSYIKKSLDYIWGYKIVI